MKIPIARTSLNNLDINSAMEPIKDGWLVQGPRVKQFEDKWSEFTKAKYSIAVTSCTSALQLSLVALDFREGDEAIVPAFTWVSTANVVEQLGGKVVFCDIDLTTFNIDPSKIKSLITPKTKVIIPVHLFGLSANMSYIMEIASNHNISIVEDAACGFGSRFDDKHVGLFGDTGCFSFHPRKAITTGEGGMITTNDKKLAEKLKCLRDHGATISDHQRHMGARPYLLADHVEAGYNSRMTDIQGALGSSQMDRAENIINERQILASNYEKAFKDLPWIQTPASLDNYIHAYQSYTSIFRPEEIKISNLKKINTLRNRFMDRLQKAGVSTRPGTHAVHMLKYYKNKYKLNSEDFPNAWIANDCSISLPLFHGMSKEEQEYVVKNVLEGFE